MRHEKDLRDGETARSHNSPSHNTEVVRLAQQLIRLDTGNPPGNELEAAEFLAHRLRRDGVEVQVQSFAPHRANLVARVRGSGPRPGLMLSGHLDTVPADPPAWSYSPWLGLIDNGRLCGRGALDMKGALAAMVVAFERVLASGDTFAGDLVLAFTAGEETDSTGAIQLCEAGLLDGIGLAVVGEPTDLGVAVAHRGALWVQVTAAGVSGHGSQPTVGVNAIRALLEWLHPLQEIEELVGGTSAVHGVGSVSLNMVCGGKAPNVIPDQASAVLDFRTAGDIEHDEILDALRARGSGVTLRVLRDATAISVSPDDPFVGATLEAVREVGVEPVIRRMPYVTDGSIFVSRLGLKTVILGPGTELDAHVNDESVRTVDLEHAERIYRSIVHRLLSQ